MGKVGCKETTQQLYASEAGSPITYTSTDGFTITL